MNKKTILLICVIIALICMPFFALDGKVLTVTGKAECKKGSADWEPVKVGTVVSENTIISTGFKSIVTVQLGGSVITVNPLSRMSLLELKEAESSVTTDMYLEVGSVKANVKPLDNKSNDFKVRSATAVASVRGTELTVTPKGVRTHSGTVVYQMNNSKSERTVTQSEEVQVSATGSITPPAAVMAQSVTVTVTPPSPSTESNSPVAAATAAPTVVTVGPSVQQAFVNVAIEIQ